MSEKPSALPSVDVVIVNWNGGLEILAAARSAIAFGGRPIVVDNGSADGSIEVVERAVPEAHCIRMGRNAGFAAACNAGVGAGQSEFVFLLNPDAEIVGGTRAEIVAAFDYDASVRIVGPAILSPDGQLTPSARRFPSVASLFLYQLKLHRLARFVPPLADYFMLDFDAREAALIDQPMGAAFIMRRTDWDAIGGLDERYFLWFEEVDLARRVANDGGRSVYWPGIAVSHIGGTSFARLRRSERQRIWNASVERYARSHFGRRGRRLLRATFPIASLLAAVLERADAWMLKRRDSGSPPGPPVRRDP